MRWPLVGEQEPLRGSPEDFWEEDEDALPLLPEAAPDAEPAGGCRHHARRPLLSVADVFRRFGAAFRQQQGETLTVPQDRVLRELTACRTPLLGTHLWQCDHCGAQAELCNSCDNRHCPTCQTQRRQEWAQQVQGTLLPIEYFHVICTTPQPLSQFAQVNAAALYPALLSTGPEAVLQSAASADGLGAQLGALAILHTWGQLLQVHLHTHLLVSGGGLSLDGQRWIAWPPGEFLPLEPISARYRRRMLQAVDQAYAQGKLVFPGPWQAIAEPAAFAQWLAPLRAIDWVVLVRSVWHRSGPQDQDAAAKTVDYLARYANRVAISNSRLLAIDGDNVTFRYKDYRDADRWKTQTIPGVEFVRRFLLHVLPRGFHHIRRFGFLGPRVAAKTLPRLRQLLGVREPAASEPDKDPSDEPERHEEGGSDTSRPCRYCGVGRMVLIAETPRPSVAEIMRMPTSLEMRAEERPVQWHLPLSAFT